MIEELFTNEWLSLKRIVDPERGVNGYVYSHETRCSGRIVVILPFRIIMDDAGGQIGDGDSYDDNVRIEFLLRNELVPCWSMDYVLSSAITGGWEVHDDTKCRDTAVREMWEESGYAVERDKLLHLGTSFSSKSSDTICYYYAIDLICCEQTGDAKGDGSVLEANATCRWVNEDDVIASYDPCVHVAYNRFRRWMYETYGSDSLLES